MNNDTFLDNKTVLITGGTGSLGKALTKHIFEAHPNIKKLIIFSRDEQKQFQMAQEYQYQLSSYLGKTSDKDLKKGDRVEI